jgi:hypothetical protein
MTRGMTLAVLAASLMEEDLSVLCAKYGLQSCQFCDALGCADNTSKEAEEWRRQHEAQSQVQEEEARRRKGQP